VEKYQKLTSLALLLITSNVFYGTSLVFYNSFLPYLVKSHQQKHSGSTFASLSNTISTYGYMLGKHLPTTEILDILSLHYSRYLESISHISRSCWVCVCTIIGHYDFYDSA
jgi:MFS-type transporter involved in bile tolerance (Atg22 family)